MKDESQQQVPPASKYRKLPVEIEAIQYTGHNDFRLSQWSGGKIVASPVLEPSEDNPTGAYTQITTLEGVMTARVGDYIIKGVKGEFYPCKPDIFHQTYLKVVNTPSIEKEEMRERYGSLDRSGSQPGKEEKLYKALQLLIETYPAKPNGDYRDLNFAKEIMSEYPQPSQPVQGKEDPKIDFDIDVLLSWISHRNDLDFLNTEMNQYVKDHKFEKAADSRDHRDAKAKILSDLEVTVNEIFEKYHFYAGEPSPQPHEQGKEDEYDGGIWVRFLDEMPEMNTRCTVMLGDCEWGRYDLEMDGDNTPTLIERDHTGKLIDWLNPLWNPSENPEVDEVWWLKSCRVIPTAALKSKPSEGWSDEDMWNAFKESAPVKESPFLQGYFDQWLSSYKQAKEDKHEMDK